MSWFGTSDPVAELEGKIEEATSESIPNGELDVAIALEITDDIRSKKVQPKQAMRSLKKRLTKAYTNPNLLSSTLKLCDMCVKNGGSHFLAEVNSKEFISYLVDVIFKGHYDVGSREIYNNEAKKKVGNELLALIQEWATYFKNSGKDSILNRAFASLQGQGYQFPPLDPLISDVAANFVDSDSPPDWVDGKECMICYNTFTVMNRKHHCRACGGVFCQTHSSNNLPLVSLGILIPVRVCDDCYQTQRISKNDVTSKSPQKLVIKGKSDRTNDHEDEDEELKRAIELSLKETLFQPSYNSAPSKPPPVVSTSNNDEDLDDDLKAAIEASLADYKEVESSSQPLSHLSGQHNAQASEPELDFYLNLMPFDVNAYAQAPPSQPTHDEGVPIHTFPDTSFQRPQAQVPPPMEASRPKQELLTEQDEENINLFVQLMNGIKADRFKQANILNDQNLNDLHGKVVRLKPKLNRTLRDSIEKYEYFLEMNNKINSITRLYDQYLEDMLNNAYNKHSIASPSTYYSSPYPNSNEPVPSQSNGYGDDVKSEYLRQQNFFQSSQGTGSQQPYWSESQQYHQQNPSQRSYPGQLDGSKKNTTLGDRMPQSETPYSVSDVIPSDLNVGAYNRQRSGSMYPVDTGALPAVPSPTFNEPEQSLPQVQINAGYSQEPSSPPEDDSDDDNESVSSRFPPIESLYDDMTPQETGSQQKPAAMRFPSLSQIENVDNYTTKPEAASMDLRHEPEPEPLIEL